MVSHNVAQAFRFLGVSLFLLAACNDTTTNPDGGDGGGSSVCSPVCVDGLTCSNGQCVIGVCAGDADCVAPAKCSSGYCADTSCSPPCGANQACFRSACFNTDGTPGSCVGGYVSCMSDTLSVCANLLRDSNNCGSCGNVCAAGTICDGTGVCAAECVAGEQACVGGCSPTDRDSLNCGTCGTVWATSRPSSSRLAAAA